MLGLEAIKTDPRVFKNKIGTIFLAIYVDDGILFGKDYTEIMRVLKHLKKNFPITIGEGKSCWL